MSIHNIRAREKLGALEQVALMLTIDIFSLIDSDRYADQLEDLVNMDDLDLNTEEDSDILAKRISNAEEKVVLRSARALLNYYTGRDDRVAELALEGGNEDVAKR